MNYSTCLMAVVASQVQSQTEIKKSLEPRLQQLVELVTLFFVPGTVSGERLGLRAGSGRAGTGNRTRGR
jgi:hypothetical protein